MKIGLQLYSIRDYMKKDMEAALKAVANAGCEYAIVEQDDHYENDSLENIKKSRDYLKTLGY